MSCIIGYVDKVNKSVYIGGDSLGSNGYTKSIESQSKVFKNNLLKNVIIGSAGSFRTIDLLKYSKDLFNKVDVYETPSINHEYVVTQLVPKIYQILQNGLYAVPDTDKSGLFIFGAQDKLFKIQHDYSVLEPQEGFCVIGSGTDIAMGSLLTTKNMDISIPEKIKLALSATEQYSCTVQRPFVIMNTLTEKIITVK